MSTANSTSQTISPFFKVSKSDLFYLHTHIVCDDNRFSTKKKGHIVSRDIQIRDGDKYV